jgi:hypothetical protein
VVVSGPNSITGVTIFIQGKDQVGETGQKDAVFGNEQLAAIVTDFPITDDAAIRAEIEKSGDITKAMSIMTEAITKSGLGRVNANGSTDAPRPKIGLQRLNLLTKPD